RPLTIRDQYTNCATRLNIPNRTTTSNLLEPGLYMLLRFQKPAVRKNCETGNQAFSIRLRFLTIRGIPPLWTGAFHGARESRLAVRNLRQSVTANEHAD